MNLKKFLAFILSGIMVMTMYTTFTVSVFAEKVASDAGDYKYTVDTSTDTVTITGVADKTITEAEIPSTIDGKTVTKIGKQAFLGCSKLVDVTIPNSITEIEMQAFYNCRKLTTVNIPASVTKIGAYAFHTCTGLTDLYVDANNTEYSSVDGVLYDKAVKKLILCPNGKSGEYTIPEGVTEIGGSSFYFSSKVTKVTIPSTVNKISSNAFVACLGLTEFDVNADNTSFADVGGVIFNKALTTIVLVPNGKSGTYTIPNGVTKIGANAFYYCTKLTSVNVPESVTTILANAFSYCTALKSISLTSNVSAIPDEVFSRCDALTDVYYVGTAEQWSGITVGTGNTAIAGKITYLTFIPPTNSAYDGKGKVATVRASADDIGTITVKYYNEDGYLVEGLPINFGTYTVKADIAESDNHSAASNITVGTFSITQSMDYSIADVKSEGNVTTTKIVVPTAGAYILIFADYEGTRLDAVKTVGITVDEENMGKILTKSENITLGAGDKVMLWSGFDKILPKCNMYEVK